MSQRQRATQPNDPLRICSETMKTIQMVSETLLLRDRDRPVSQETFAGCCDSLVARSRAISLAINNVEGALKDNNSGIVGKGMVELAENICIIGEMTAQAVFLAGENDPHGRSAVPGIIDPYPFTRGRLAIRVAIDGLKRENLSPEDTMAYSSVVASNLERLQQECTDASEASEHPFIKSQFKACVRALAGTTSALVSAIKEFVQSPTRTRQKQLEIFIGPLLACIDAIIDFMFTEDSLFGTPPKPSPEAQKRIKPIQAAGLTVVSASALFAQAVKASLSAPQDHEVKERVSKYCNKLFLVLISNRYASAAEDGLAQLTLAVQKAKDEQPSE